MKKQNNKNKNKKTNRTVRQNTIHTSSNEKKMIINPDVTEKANITKKTRTKTGRQTIYTHIPHYHTSINRNILFKNNSYSERLTIAQVAFSAINIIGS